MMTGSTHDRPSVSSVDGVSMPVADRLSFREIAAPGFGDRANTWAWSMHWWRGKLYVGTNRVWHCAERAGIHSAFPFLVKYPSRDPDAQCAADPTDLALEAEIWRWTPEEESWERVYRSPRDIPIPGRAGKFVAREVGLRDIASFVEPDGTEALYVSGVNAHFIFRPIPGPQLLRSTDGTHFAPVPQAPGSFLGELEGRCTFRSIVRYKERMFLTVGTIQGDGVLLESHDPAAGNDSFRQVSPPGMTVFEILPYNGFLYVGVRDVGNGYAVLKTDASGEPPYHFTPVVRQGAHLPEPSRGVISMQIFNGRLYVGTDRPATEIIRINPDDSWELVIGAPRQTPDGMKYPLSGLDAGFNNWLNGHIWRMQSYQGRLYVGTMKMATHLRDIAGIEPVLAPNYGFDLFESGDGWRFAPITTNGFDNKFACGLRSFAVTPYGLAMGVANNWYGLQVWLGSRPAVEQDPPPLGPAERLEVEETAVGPLLSWEPAPGAARYRIYRALVSDQRRAVDTHPILTRILRVVRRMVLPLIPNLYLPPLPRQIWIPGAYEELALSERRHFLDTAAEAGERYAYYVRAEGQDGRLAMPSNMVAVPLLTPPVTFDRLLEAMAQAGVSGLPAQSIGQARRLFVAGDPAAAAALLTETAGSIGADEGLDGAIVHDLRVLIGKLARRLNLCYAGLLSGETHAF